MLADRGGNAAVQRQVFATADRPAVDLTMRAVTLVALSMQSVAVTNDGPFFLQSLLEDEVQWYAEKEAA